MGISKFLTTIPEITGKCEIWSHSKVVKRCLEAGQNLAEIAKENDGKLTIENLNDVYGRILPRGSNIQAVSDPKVAATFLKGMNLGEDTISFITNGAQAFVVKNFKGKILFFVPIEKFAEDKAVSVATHEFEHAANNVVTLRAKVQNLLFKVLGAKRVERIALKNSEAVSIKAIKLQQDLIGGKLKITNPLDGTVSQSADTKGLLEYLKVPSNEELALWLRSSVRQILDPNAERKNVKCLKAMIDKSMTGSLTDEARAYGVGGQSAKKYLGLKKGSTMSEMTSQLYKETVNVIKEEIKAQREKGLKRALGMKVWNYEGVPEIEIDPSKFRELEPWELPPEASATLDEKVSSAVNL